MTRPAAMRIVEVWLLSLIIAIAIVGVQGQQHIGLRGGGGSRATVAIHTPEAAAVGSDTTSNASILDFIPEVPKCFETTQELRDAVHRYQNGLTFDPELAQTYGWPIGSWCVSEITDFSQLFSAQHHRYFNEPLASWNMAQATDLTGMFQNCHIFNQPLGAWDVSSVTTMSRMFASARSFDQDLSPWNTARVQDFSYMFLHAFSFQHVPNAWSIASATTMEGMFRDARSLEGAALTWDLSRVENTNHMISEIAGVSLNLRGGSSQASMAGQTIVGGAY